MARNLMLEFERAKLVVQPVAEIDSLLLVMRYCLAGNRATVQPMSATLLLGAPQRWRCLAISDVPLTRNNYLYALPPHKMSAAASIVRTGLRRVVTELVERGAWRGVRLVPALTEEAAPAPDLPQS